MYYKRSHGRNLGHYPYIGNHVFTIPRVVIRNVLGFLLCMAVVLTRVYMVRLIPRVEVNALQIYKV